MIKHIKILLVCLFFFLTGAIYAQQVMSLEQAIAIAHNKSPQVLVANLSFMSKYWNYKSYKAQFLPSFSLQGTAGNYNSSLIQLQDYNTGEIKYIRNNILSNAFGLTLVQNIPFTGGTISFNTDLYRLDQFTNKSITYNSNPVTINYIQPLRAYNELKWQKRTAPLEYEQAKRNLLESMEDITITVTSYYFEALNKQYEYEKALMIAEDNHKLYDIAQQRLKLGSIRTTEFMQIELVMLQSDLAVNDSRISFDIAMNDLCIYLGMTDINSLKLVIPANFPDIQLDYEHVLDMALNNSSFSMTQKLKMLNASNKVAQAKSHKGLQATFSANLGVSQSADKIKGAYKDLRDQEIMSITLTMPIFDWGLARGRVKMAQTQVRLVETEMVQEELEYKKKMSVKVRRFNNQAKQCEISHKAMQVADERYRIVYKQFENGSITVDDLNTAQYEQKNASNQYIVNIGILWNLYFEIRKETLFDFIKGQNISAEFDKIM